MLFSIYLLIFALLNCNLRGHLNISISCTFDSFYTFFFNKTWFQPRSSGAAMKTPGWPGLRLRGRGTDQLQNHDHKNWLVLCFEWDTKALYWFQISCEGIKIYFTPLKSAFFIYLVKKQFKQDAFSDKFTHCCSTKSNLRAEYLWVLCSC